MNRVVENRKATFIDYSYTVFLGRLFFIASIEDNLKLLSYSKNYFTLHSKVKYEVTEDVYTSRKKQHQTMMHYFCALNTLQYKKKIALLEPLLGYMQAQVIP